MMQNHAFTVRRSKSGAGFSLIELLISMAIMLVVLGASMTAMMNVVRANQTATMTASMNANLRTAMDLITRDLLQTGQDLPIGRLILIPSGDDANLVRLPGPPDTTAEVADGTTELSAVTARPGAGPEVNEVATDVITILAADSAFSNIDLTAITSTSMTVALPPPANCATLLPPTCGINGVDISSDGVADILEGQLIMLTKGSLSTLVQVTSVDGAQTVTFAEGDSLLLNQPTPVTVNGNLAKLNAAAPVNSAAETQASRIRMITYYIDATDGSRPRLVRRMNNGHATDFDNDLGTVVAFDIENLQFSFDIANGGGNPANVKMTAADTDVAGTGACTPSPCSPNQIRKVNVMLTGRSSRKDQTTQLFLRNTLTSQVSLRSMAFVDKYTNAP